MAETKDIAYVPVVLNSLAQICKKFRARAKTVKLWMEQGAPIYLEQDGKRKRYFCEVAALFLWRKEQAKRKLPR